MVNEFVVHCPPVGHGLGGLEYLAPYVFRVAISNNRNLKLADGKVTFRCRATDAGKLRTSTLAAEEFIRRFLQHVLHRGFVRVRCYPWLCLPGHRKTCCCDNSSSFSSVRPSTSRPSA